jgi:ATP-dependent RNA helicase DDX46/PRP5
LKPDVKPEVKPEVETKPAGIKPLMALNANGDVKKVKKTVTIVTGVATKKNDAKKKGDVMEQNQDALEYSSEEEETSKCSKFRFSVKLKSIL